MLRCPTDSPPFWSSFYPSSYSASIWICSKFNLYIRIEISVFKRILRIFLTQSHTQRKKGLQSKDHNPLILLVRPAGFEPAAYGFEVPESENSKMLWFQPVDSIQLFQLTFGFVWKYLEIFDLDGHILGTVASYIEILKKSAYCQTQVQYPYLS